jgi:hypothetical protein
VTWLAKHWPAVLAVYGAVVSTAILVWNVVVHRHEPGQAVKVQAALRADAAGIEAAGKLSDLVGQLLTCGFGCGPRGVARYSRIACLHVAEDLRRFDRLRPDPEFFEVFHFCGVDLTNPAHAAEVLEACQGTDLAIVDTLSACSKADD